MAISTGFNTALTGLKAHQQAIDVTGENISNASNPDYVRQRAIFSSFKPINQIPGDIGIGVEISSINRITDTYLFNRYISVNATLQNFKTQEEYLQEIATYFPDVQDQGLFKDLKDFFNTWQTFASNPNDGAVKVDLAYKTQKLTNTFHTLRKKLSNIQESINGEIDTHIQEVNNIIKNIANLNKEITLHEANGKSHANELRDKRDALEKRLKELIDVKVFKTGIKSMDSQGNESVDYSNGYSIMLGGYPLLDGSTYHELQKIDSHGNINIGVLKEDFSIADVTDSIKNSKIGALLNIRGTDFNKEGIPFNGTIGDMISSLDSLAAGMIRSINSIYSYSAKSEVYAPQQFKPISISDEIAKTPLTLLANEGVLAHKTRNGILKLDVLDNNGDIKTTLNISIKTNDSINNVLKKINEAIKNYDSNFDIEAKIINGEIKFVPSDTNGDNNINPKGNILVKNDGSLLFDLLQEYEYLPLKKINSFLPLPLQNGSFDVVVYDENGEELARRTIKVDMKSTDSRYSTLQGIINQINVKNIDDNNDNDPNNDVDDLYEAKIINGRVIFTKKTTSNTYIGLDNDSANFGGVFGINQFFEGNNAKNIELRKDLKENPSLIHAYKAPNKGNNEIANAILELQFQKINFYKNNQTSNATIYEYYRSTTSSLANEVENISMKKDSAQTLFKSISNEYYSLTGVNIDEELINLEKYQRGYQANARVISTINQMLDALFSIKH